jgi:hypothetical protein
VIKVSLVYLILNYTFKEMQGVPSVLRLSIYLPSYVSIEKFKPNEEIRNLFDKKTYNKEEPGILSSNSNIPFIDSYRLMEPEDPKDKVNEH